MTYDYFCEQCQSAFELQHSIADCDKPHACIICGAPSARRRITTFPQVLWVGRAILKEEGIWDSNFPTMQSVRREDRLHHGFGEGTLRGRSE